MARFTMPKRCRDPRGCGCRLATAAAPTANWSHIEDGTITAIRVTFDARPLAPPETQ